MGLVTAKLSGFSASRSHREEGDEMFKKARKVLSEEDHQTLGSRLEKAKQEQRVAKSA